MTAQQINARIEKLMRTAESGADWAEICRLESEAIALEQECPDCEGKGCVECDGPEHRCAI